MSRLHAMFAVALLAQLPWGAEAQVATYQPPRTPEGHPDFQGSWGTNFLTPLERRKDVKELRVTPEQAHAIATAWLSEEEPVDDPDLTHFGATQLAVVRGELRTSWVVEPADGLLPLSASALSLIEGPKRGDTYGYDNPEEQGASIRCLTGLGQAPIRVIPIFVPYQIVQTPEFLVLMTEDVAGFRVVDLTGAPPPPAALRSYEGYSAGTWEGDTLVIRTTHLRADDPFREPFGRPMVVGADSTIVEKLTRLSSTELLYQFTIEDPGLYTRPWLGEFSMTWLDGPIYEYACHEGNRSLANTLLAGRTGNIGK